MNDSSSTPVTSRAAWRALQREAVIAPEQKICDAHHHLWGHAGDRYFAEEFAADLSDGHNVLKTVYVECGSNYREEGPAELMPLGETEFVLQQEAELARLLGRSVIAGIIGFADLRLGDAVEAVLEAHLEVAGKKFSGVRHATAWDRHEGIVNHQLDPPAALMSDAAFVAGVAKLGEHKLTYDAWLYHPQIEEVAVLARAAPGTTIVLDHLGAPLGIGPYANRRDEILTACRKALQDFAALPNARLKLGGIGMTLYGNGWHKLETPPDSSTIATSWADHIRWCIDTFGPNRVMFESNFPPDGRSCSYRTLWNAYKRIAQPYNQAEQDALFHDTAVQVYGL